MFMNRVGAQFQCEGVTYTIGGKVCANDASDYEGLYGTITEIRDGDDRETGAVQAGRKNLAKPGAFDYDRGQRSDADETAVTGKQKTIPRTSTVHLCPLYWLMTSRP